MLIKHILLYALFLPLCLSAQIRLVKTDTIADPPSGSKPVITCNGKLFFTGQAAATGTELWVTNGQPGTSPTLLRDFEPGVWGSEFTQFMPVDSVLYFVRVNFMQTRREIWKTDGTPEGTAHLFDQQPAVTLAGVLPDAVLFSVGTKLKAWHPDGTQETLSDSYGGSLACLGGKAYFGGSLPGMGQELLQTDGTQAGTSLFLEIHPGITGSAPAWFTPGLGRIFFMAYHPASGKEWWSSDGTSAGTRMVWEGAPGSTSSELGPLRRVNGHFYVALVGAAGDQKLVSWDSDADTTAWLWQPQRNPYPLIHFFSAPDRIMIFAESYGIGATYWQTDGTRSGTGICQPLDQLLYDVPNPSLQIDDSVIYAWGYRYNGQPGTGSYPSFVRWDGGASAAMENRAINSPAVLHHHALYYGTGELWRTEGGDSTTVPVHNLPNIPRGSGVNAPLLCQLNDTTVVFKGRESAGEGWELYRTDGTAAGTRLVKNIHPGAASCNLEMTQKIGNEVFLSVNDGIHGQELWVTDGTEAGTRLVADLVPGPESAFPRKVCMAGETLVCEGWPDMADTLHYWLVDRNHQTGVSLHDILPGFAGNSLTHPVYLNGQLYLLDGALNGPQTFWQTDGTTAGSQQPAPLPPNITPTLLLPGKDVLYCWGMPFNDYDNLAFTSYSPATRQWQPVYTTPSTPMYDGQDAAALSSGVLFAAQENKVLTFFHFTAGGKGTILLRRAIPASVTSYAPTWQTVGEVAYCNLRYGVFISDGTPSGSMLIPYRYRNQPIEIGSIRIEKEEIWCYAGRNTYRLDQEADTLVLESTSILNQKGIPMPGGELFVYNPAYGDEWWILPPADTIPSLVKDLYPFEEEEFMQNLFTNSLSDSVAFVRDVGNLLWRATVSGSGARPFATAALSRSVYPYDAGPHLVLRERLIFVTEKNEVFATDTLPGTPLVKLAALPPGWYESALFALKDKALWISKDSTGQTLNLWESDGTPAGTRILQSLGPCGSSTWWGRSPGEDPHEVLILVHTGNGSGETIWRTDGTPAGTRIIAPLSLGELGSIVDVCRIGQKLALSTRNDSLGIGYILLTDTLGQQIDALWSMSWSQLPADLLALGDSVYFFIASPDNQGIVRCTLWGAGENSLLATEIRQFPVSHTPVQTRIAHNRLWFNFGVGGLWRSDGTAAGTVPLSIPADASVNADLREAVQAGNMLLTEGWLPGYGASLWGAPAYGTQLIPLPMTDIDDDHAREGAKVLVRNQLFFGGKGSALYAWDIPTLETLPGERAYLLPDVQGNAWRYAFHDGYTVAAIHPQGLDLGTVTIRMDDRNNVQEIDSQAFAPRHYALSCAGGKDCPADGKLPRAIRLQLYFADAELEALEATTGQAVSVSETDIVHYNGLTNDCDLSNNPLPGYSSRIPADSMQAHDWWAGYYVEFSTGELGEFALTTPAADSLPQTLLLWPNPGQDMLHIQVPCAEAGTVTLFDMAGKHIETLSGTQHIRLSVENLRPGLYLVQVQTPCGTATGRWVKY